MERKQIIQDAYIRDIHEYPNYHYPQGAYSFVGRKNCNHTKGELRVFHDKPNAVCTHCQSTVNFCADCRKVFAVTTLQKYTGRCGRCNTKAARQVERDEQVQRDEQLARQLTEQELREEKMAVYDRDEALHSNDVRMWDSPDEVDEYPSDHWIVHDYDSDEEDEEWLPSDEDVDSVG